MTEIFRAYGKEIFAVAVPILIWILNYVFRARAKLHWATPHAFAFHVQEPLLDADGKVISPAQIAYTKSLTIANDGRATATKVELVFNWKPTCLNIWPPRHYEEFEEPDNRYTLIFDSLAPKEYIGCYLLSVNTNLPDLVTARSDQCAGKEIFMYPQPIVANWKRRLAVFLLFVGIAASVYFLIVLLQLLILKTPVGH